MPCDKEQYVEVTEPNNVENICKDILEDKLFGFCQVDIHVPDHLREKFSEFAPLFIIDIVPEDLVPEHMKKYKEATDRKTLKDSRKLLGVTKAKKILLYTPMIKWYLNHGLIITAVYKYLKYKPSRPFAWFPKEVSEARRNGDNEPHLKQLGDTFKLKGNSFYGKMIEDVEKHTKTSYTNDEKTLDTSFRSPYFDDLEIMIYLKLKREKNKQR